MPDIYISEEDKKKKKSEKGEGKTPLTKTFQDLKKKERHALPGHRHYPLASFCYLPDDVKFETQEHKEKIILLVRRHPITNIPWFLVAIILSLAPLTLSFFPIIDFLPSNFRFVIILMWYLIVTAFVFENFLSWFFDINLITDERIIDVDFYNLIYKQVSDTKIDKIQDVTYNQGGAIRAIFNFGDVLIQTASEVPNFEFLAIPNPDRVVQIINDLIIEEEQEKLEGRAR